MDQRFLHTHTKHTQLPKRETYICRNITFNCTDYHNDTQDDVIKNCNNLFLGCLPDDF